MLFINPRSGVPIWEQIKEQLKERILLGVWSPGEQLPSVRSLASELGINPNTIQRAYTEIEREGLVYTVSGKGCFVEDDLTAIQTKRSVETLEKLDRITAELISAGIPLETVIERIEKSYKEVNGSDQN